MMKKALVICFWDIQKKKTYQQYFHISGLFSFVCFCCCLLAIWKTKQNKIVTQDALFWLSKDNGKDDDDDFDDDNVFFVWLFFSCKEIKCRSIYIFVLLLFSVFAEWIFGWLNGWMDVFPRLNTVFTKIMVWLFFLILMLILSDSKFPKTTITKDKRHVYRENNSFSVN